MKHIKSCRLGIKDSYRFVFITLNELSHISLTVIAQEIRWQKRPIAARSDKSPRGSRRSKHLHTLQNTRPGNEIMRIVHHG